MSAKRCVVDTSALVRLYVPDGPVDPALEPALAAAAAAQMTVLIPELALAEAAQVLLKKERAGVLAPAEVQAIWRALARLPLAVVGHRALLASAQRLARRLRLTVYDGLFLALAMAHTCALITGDARLAAAGRTCRLPQASA